MKPLLVGELNPYGSDPKYALYPHPERSAGGRLCRGVLGMTAEEYLLAFDRENLCAGRWSMPAARAAAHSIQTRRRSHPSVAIILLGAKVCDAFGVDFEPHTVSRRYSPRIASENDVTFGELEATFVILPHPSGRSRLWNEPGAADSARRALREAGALPRLPEDLGPGIVRSDTSQSLTVQLETAK